MTKTYTTTQAAALLNVALPTVQGAARRNKIGGRFGKAIQFTEADIEKLRAVLRGKPGNPNMTEGSTYWKKRLKKRKK